MRAVAVWALYQLRMRQVARALNARFDERLAERTRMARDLHDTLLQTVQGSKMVVDNALNRPDDDGHAAGDGTGIRLAGTGQHGRTRGGERAARLDDGKERPGGGVSPRDRRLRAAGFAARRRFRSPAPPGRCIPWCATRSTGSDTRPSATPARIPAATAWTSGSRYARDLMVRVSDNGAGIDPAVASGGRDGHFGLQGMRERAARIGATLTVDSSAGSGTAIMLTVPGRVVFHEQTASLFARTEGAVHELKRPRCRDEIVDADAGTC